MRASERSFSVGCNGAHPLHIHSLVDGFLSKVVACAMTATRQVGRYNSSFSLLAGFLSSIDLPTLVIEVAQWC